MKSSAIILAGGTGKRMGSEIPKQYLLINNRPLLYYTIMAFEKSVVDEIVIVANDIDYLMENVISKYHFDKISKVVSGGRERFDSVYNGLCAIESTDVVLIHDGARPLVNTEVIAKTIDEAIRYGACCVGVRVKDTIKVCDDSGFAVDTPNRKSLWAIQTPQTFEYSLIKKAHDIQHEKQDMTVTDDACVVERFTDCKVHILEGDYKNIKITTPDDLELAKLWLDKY